MTIALALLALALPCLILTAWHLERRELLNRIKPETAQYVAPRQTDETPTVRHDDDAGYWSATMGMSREELAEAVDAQERQMALATTFPEGA